MSSTKAPYTASYVSLPTFASTNIGYIVPGSQLTPINIPASSAPPIPYDTNYLVGQFPNVEHGVYIFNYNGVYVGAVGETWLTYLSTSMSPTTATSNCNVITYSFTSFFFSTPFFGTNSATMSTIVQVPTTATYYIIIYTPNPGTPAASRINNCSFSLCRIG
jgi:hypothetical protein